MVIVCILSHEYTEYTLYLPIPANSIIFHHLPGSLKTIVPGSRERPSHVRGQAHGPIGPPSSPWNGPSDEWIIGIYPDGWMDGWIDLCATWFCNECYCIIFTYIYIYIYILYVSLCVIQLLDTWGRHDCQRQIIDVVDAHISHQCVFIL